MAPRRGVYFRVLVYRLHLAAPAVVVLESAHSPGAGRGFVRLAFGDRRIARHEFARVPRRDRCLAMVARKLRRFPDRSSPGSRPQLPLHVIYRWCGYACWCVLQQLLFQNMAYRRLRDGLGASWKTSSIAGAMFAAAHIPNPILVPATFLVGNCFHAIVRSPPQRSGAGSDASHALRHALRHHSRGFERPVPRGPWILGRTTRQHRALTLEPPRSALAPLGSRHRGTGR